MYKKTSPSTDHHILVNSEKNMNAHQSSTNIPSSLFPFPLIIRNNLSIQNNFKDCTKVFLPSNLYRSRVTFRRFQISHMISGNGTKLNRGNGQITISNYRFSFYSNLQESLFYFLLVVKTWHMTYPLTVSHNHRGSLFMGIFILCMLAIFSAIKTLSWGSPSSFVFKGRAWKWVFTWKFR